ncbi:hypothetical protein OPKNFCMD_2954 [Methylobacterium crusticola]|uniref:Leucine-binding protein domain-containing protein n=1 Tax=Methylobacterium crusticola TaxID=1697972 RepID=A0ABQ4QXU7_9HYPH|nr:ABC transporter substrate-binding protein [Methylobacterium crusticola]GJD50217.1 hypothetical protein OPKNFCMD_2954 [Methylobacterium crusticola]
MRHVLVAAALAGLACLSNGPAAAEISDGVVRIGVLSDMAGVYADITGRGSVVAARMAAEDCAAAECAGLRVEILSADHQNKADVASALAREWIDRQGVDALADMSNAAIQLAVPPLLREKNRVGLFPGGTARLTGDACDPGHIVQWMWDTYGQVAGIVRQVAAPGMRWFLVAADYALGHQLEADTRSLVAARGGSVVGAVRHAFPAVDLSSPLLTAQASGAEIVALANAGGDTIAAIRTAREFGLTGGAQRLVAYFLTVMDVRSLGLEAAQGTILTEGFYWDLDAGTRAFSRRFRERHGTVPSTIHAGIYSAVRHYLRAVAATRSDEAGTVIGAMRALPIDDEVVRNARLREDGRMVHDVYVFRVKAPGASTGEWDTYDRIATIPGDEAFRPLAESTCPALRR